MKLVIPERAQIEIEKEDAWWREHRRDARELFTEELATTLDEVLMQPEVPRPYRKTRKGRAPRADAEDAPARLLRVEAEEVVVIVTVWGAVRGKKPNLSLE